MKEVVNIFDSKSFAVVGVSRNKNKVGRIIYDNLLKNGIKVVGINSKAEQISNHRIYKDISLIPFDVDCVIIATPKESVPLILRQAGRKKIPNAIIITSGFSEANENKLENRLLQISKEENIRILGPNCFGYVNTDTNTNTTFFQGDIKKGNIGFISQSGAISSSMLDKIGKFSKLITLGNALDIGFTESLEYLINDKNTSIICLYIESLSANEGQKFIDISKKSKKTIIALKSGKTKSGQKAATTHTSALATNSKIYSGIFKQAGIIEVDSITEMFQIASIINRYSKIENNFAIITNAGGYGVLISDYCEENKINLVDLKQETLNNLDKILPENWSKNNPLDILGDADSNRYESVLKILQEQSYIKNLIVILTPQYMSEPEKTAKLLSHIKKPIFCCFLGGEKIKTSLEILQNDKIINFSEPERLCKILGKIIN